MTPVGQTAPVKPTEALLLQALRERHSGDAWGFLTHVRNATGFPGRVRTADAIAMGLWPSRGLEVHGFEVKVSRQDWLNELAEAAKAEEIARFCDRWWIVAPPLVVLPTELPAMWGLMVWGGHKVKVEVQAPKLDAQPVTRPFLASLFRSLHGVHRDPAEIVKAREEGVRAGRGSSAYALERLQGELDELKARVNAFEAASGVRIDRWGDQGHIGDAVRVVLNGDGSKVRRRVEGLRDVMARAVGDFDAILAQPDMT